VFWLDRPVGQVILERWLAGAPVDDSTFRPVQAIYVAKPILRDGMRDPVPVRSGILDGWRDEVRVPEFAPEEPKPAPRPTISPEGKRYVSGARPSVAEKRLDASRASPRRSGTRPRPRRISRAGSSGRPGARRSGRRSVACRGRAARAGRRRRSRRGCGP
jgi:hypothetical protein